MVVIDTTGGPVTIDDNAHLGPLAVIQGPAYIGVGACVLPHRYTCWDLQFSEVQYLQTDISRSRWISVIHSPD